MKMEMTGLWLRQTEQFCDKHILIYLVMVSQIMIATSTEPLRAIVWVTSLLAVTTEPLRAIVWVNSLLAVNIYQVIPDRSHKLKNRISTNVLIKRKMVMHMEYISLSSQLIRDRPFNLKWGGGVWFFASFRNFFSDNTRVRIFIFFVAQSAKFFSRIQH